MRLPFAALGLALFALHSAALAGGVTVVLRLGAPDAVEVGYEMLADCHELSFLKYGAGATQIRAKWHAQDECGTAGGDMLVGSAAACPALRFRVPVTSGKVRGSLFDDEPAGDEDAPALPFSGRRESGATNFDYFDPALSALADAQIRSLAGRSARFLHAAMPHAVFHPAESQS